MLTGNLQIKNDTYYAVINYKQGEKYKQKWISTKLKTTGNKRRATEFLNSVIEKYSEMDLKKKMWNIKFTDYVTKGFQKVLKKSGFSHMRFHDLRHSCASIIHDKGYSLKKFRNGLDIPILKQQVTYMFTF